VKITFLPDVFWINDRDSIAFHADVDSKRIRCVVPQDFLTAPLVKKPSEAEARLLFSERRNEIELRLRDKIQKAGLVCPDEIVLRP
jgi:hypothetical protein